MKKVNIIPIVLGATLATNITSAFADANKCLEILGQAKAEYSLNLSKALKRTGNFFAIVKSGQVDLGCSRLVNENYSLNSIDECFTATRGALNLFDKDTVNQLFEAQEWESLRVRVQKFKTQGTCEGRLAHKAPVFEL